MKLQTVVRDCLFLNWALPVSALPEPPSPLRYQLHEWHGADHVFATAQLFHLDAVRWSSLPLPRVGYPQLSVGLCVLDGEGVPAVLFLRALMPVWVAPGARLLSHQPAAGAWLDFPRPSRGVSGGGGDSWRWRARCGGTLTVRASLHSPRYGEGPHLGSWDETVRYIQERPRGYAEGGGTLHRVDSPHAPAGNVWPLAAEVRGDAELLDRLLSQLSHGNGNAAAWPEPHSAWLCPEMPLIPAYDLVHRTQPAVAGLPHPAAGRVSVAAFLGSPHPAAALAPLAPMAPLAPLAPMAPIAAALAPLAPLALAAAAAPAPAARRRDLAATRVHASAA